MKRPIKAYQFLIALLFAAACRTQTADTITGHDVATLSAATGGVSVNLIPDPSSPKVQLGPDEEYVQPRLNGSNPQPAYPAQLVPLRLPSHVVVVRATFDEEGRVMKIGSSPIAASTADEYEPVFESAVTDAVRQWKCFPPEIRKYKPGADLDGDGKSDYRIVTANRKLKTFFDLSFTFDVIDGVPVVKSAGK